jgi:competence protein ComEC
MNSSRIINSLQIYEPLFGQKVELFGTVQDDAAYNAYGDYEFNVTKLNFAGDGEFLPGRIRVRTKQNVAVYRGDRIFISGTLKPALGARTGSISYANVEVIELSPSKLESLRLKFFQSVLTSLPEPHASLGIGFLAGVRSSIPKDFQDKLSRVGLTHIIAVSGYNLTILVMAISKLGKKLSKYQRLIISLSLIFTFLLITGFSASVVRAALVSLISLVSLYYGRRVTPLNIILITAVITAGINPVYLWEDIGWWLSFLAFFGVLILAPIFKSKIYKDKEPSIMAGIVLESFSAQLLTAPLVAHVFGTFSIISLLANVLVVPWIPIIMLLVFIFGAIGMIAPGIALILGILPKIILTPIISVIEKLASLSWASTQLKLSQFGMLLIYFMIFIFIRLSNKNSRSSELIPSE